MICTLNDGLFGAHCAEEDEFAELALWSELFKLTSPTPSIRRRRWSVSATSDWLPRSRRA